jgi:uncharacterized protein YqeY
MFYICKKLEIMSLKEKISKDYMTAFKERNTVTKNLLSVIKGEIQTIEKNTGVDCLSDVEVIKILNKTAKSLNEVITISGDEESKLQLTIVEALLPKPLTREDIVAKVNELVASGVTNVGGIMKEFATLQVDRKVVSEVIKEVLV